ncbi:MAG TPA: MoaD/ThiS family protein [Bacteroidetes bacterium]|nr:MoaD/ThiS family protein [Bacteroidota bacterium]HRR09154.1 MoaD/ThiS family protein [Rhodothermales bacterium]
MQIQVLLFSVLKDQVGHNELNIMLAEGASGADLLDRLEAEFPPIRSFRPFIRLGVNQSFCAEDVILKANDQVALITPVSGG